MCGLDLSLGKSLGRNAHNPRHHADGLIEGPVISVVALPHSVVWKRITTSSLRPKALPDT
jgi:hypothetical protein